MKNIAQIFPLKQGKAAKKAIDIIYTIKVIH